MISVRLANMMAFGNLQIIVSETLQRRIDKSVIHKDSVTTMCTSCTVQFMTSMERQKYEGSICMVGDLRPMDDLVLSELRCIGYAIYSHSLRSLVTWHG